MNILLNNIYASLEQGIIDKEQALYLIYTYNSIDYPIDAVPLFELTKLKYVVGNKIGKELLIENNINLSLSGTIKAFYESEISKQIPQKLLHLVCSKGEKPGSVYLPDNEQSIQTTADVYLDKEGLIAHHYIIFLNLFPTIKEKNRKWEAHFTGFPYKGVRLRIRSKRTGKAFKRIAKTRDMGVFLYGTYLFIQSCIRENKTYIKTIPHYLEEYEDWYEEAKEAINKSTDVNSLFNKTLAKEGRVTISI